MDISCHGLIKIIIQEFKVGNNIQNLLFIWGAVNLIPTLKWNSGYFLAELLAANQTFINSHNIAT